MEAVFHGLQGIFEILFMIGIGFVLSKKGWFGPDTSAILTRLIIRIWLCPFCLSSWPTSWAGRQLRRCTYAGSGRASLLPVFLSPIRSSSAFPLTWPYSVRRACLRSCCIIWRIRRCSGSWGFITSSTTVRAAREICRYFRCRQSKRCFRLRWWPFSLAWR